MTQISRAKSAAASAPTSGVISGPGVAPGLSRRGRRSMFPAAPAAASSIALVAVRWELFRLGTGESEDNGTRTQGPWELSLVVAMDRGQPETSWRGTVQISPTGDRRIIALEQFTLDAAAGGADAGDSSNGEPRQASARAVLRIDRAAGLVHVDAPGFLSATFEIDRAGSTRVLFASTPVLAAMKIPGGTYEVLGGSLTRVV
jgi:hypothetical protein